MTKQPKLCAHITLATAFVIAYFLFIDIHITDVILALRRAIENEVQCYIRMNFLTNDREMGLILNESEENSKDLNLSEVSRSTLNFHIL